mmetsp:Transcript_21781/g.55663  ORF Transcript_21781/g.55663 Transcript_21781/m.55663 type:complete len:82 (+) Transcript_21781:406-651(+)
MHEAVNSNCRVLDESTTLWCMVPALRTLNPVQPPAFQPLQAHHTCLTQSPTHLQQPLQVEALPDFCPGCAVTPTEATSKCV